MGEISGSTSSPRCCGPRPNPNPNPKPNPNANPGQVLWAKAEYPLRAALMASQLCQRLSTNPKLRADSDELTASYMAYEDLAIELLDAVRESDDAAPLLTLMPWEWSAGKGKGDAGFSFYFDEGSQRWAKDPTGKRGGTLEDWEGSMVVGGASGEAYAPWPLVHTALQAGGLESVEPERALELQSKGATIVDIRTADKYAKKHIAGSVNVPLFRPVQGRSPADNAKRLAMAFFQMTATERNSDFAAEALEALPKNKPVVVACDIGGTLEVTIEKKRGGKVVKAFEDKERVFGRESRSLKACYELKKAGFSKLYHLKDGQHMWEYKGLPME